jgi:hypothetical protein
MKAFGTFLYRIFRTNPTVASLFRGIKIPEYQNIAHEGK